MLKNCMATALVIALVATPAVAQNWWSKYKVGDEVMFTVSERAADLQPCTVAEADPDYGIRVQCQAFKHWAAGKYIVYHPNNIGEAPVQNTAQPSRPAATAPSVAQNWWSKYKVGDEVMFTVSERAADLQPCTVAEADPDYGIRVQCQAFKHWAAGKYIVYHPNNIGGAPAQNTAQPSRPAATAPSKGRPKAAPGKGPLKPGEYACYGTGGTLLIGLGFKLAADGSYTDLEGRNRGRLSASGDSVIFTGGTLGGKTARRLDGNRFAFGYATTCEPW